MAVFQLIGRSQLPLPLLHSLKRLPDGAHHLACTCGTPGSLEGGDGPQPKKFEGKRNQHPLIPWTFMKRRADYMRETESSVQKMEERNRTLFQPPAIMAGMLLGSAIILPLGLSKPYYAWLSSSVSLLAMAAKNILFSLARTFSIKPLHHFSSMALSLANQSQAKGMEAIVMNINRRLNNLSYILDVLLERNPCTYIFLLMITCVLLTFVGGICFHLCRKQRLGDSLWDAWAHLCSSSTHLKNQTLSERIIGMALALGGLFFYSLLTSTMTAQFKLRMEWLREGAHSQVRETGHILICGVNDRIITVLRQLNKSHEFALRVGQADKKRQTVLILSEQSKKETERVIASLDKEWPLLNVLVRSGSLSSTFSFESVAADKTRTILIFSNKKDMYAADADVALCMLGLQPLLEGYTGKVIAEVSSTSTGKLIQSLSQSKAEPVQNLSSKIFVQCSRQRALIDVYCQLLDHSKQIINIRNYPSLFGFQYRDIRRGFPEAIICGFIRAKKVNFHPDDKEVLQVDDKLLVIAPKHTHSKAPDALLASTMPEPPMSKNVPIKKGKQVAKHSKSCKVSGKKELILMLGWRTDVCDMVLEYDEYVGPGSELVILAECSPDKRRAHIASRIQKPLKNITVVHKIGNPLYQVDLQNAILDATRGQGRPPLSIVAITDERGTTGDIIKPDKQTMYALLLAEELCKEHMIQVASLVAEVVDKKLGKQVADTQTSLRYIAASEVTGLVTTQVTEHPELNMVWTELLNSWGNEIYVKDIMLYIEAGETLSFSQLSERAVSRHEVAIGYRKGSNIVINPPKKDISLELLQGDALVVICENE